MRKPKVTQEIRNAAAEMFALANSGTGPLTWEQHRQWQKLEKTIAESQHCPHCAAYDGSLQPLAPHEASERPDEYGGSECCTCEEFVVWGPQCPYEYATCDDGHSDADPGL